MTIKELYNEAKKLKAENLQLYTIDENCEVTPVDFRLTLDTEEDNESWLYIEEY